MKHKIERMLIDNGASMVGFAKITGLYSSVDLMQPRNEAILTEPEPSLTGIKLTEPSLTEPTSTETKLTEPLVTGPSLAEPINVPQYPYGISIVLSYPQYVIKNITHSPTMDYYNAYHRLNDKLDELAVMCAEYIKDQGYHAYPQTVAATKEFGVFRTVMPHKTVAVNAGLGWIGKSALFITEKYGSAVRLTSVLTDAPLDYNKLIIHSKCDSCMLCTHACPGKAISGRAWSPDLDRDEFFDALACRKKAREIAAKSIDKQITLCGKCIEVCPYTRKYTHASSLINNDNG